jgi:uncharacterized protein with HEPN domain
MAELDKSLLHLELIVEMIGKIQKQAARLNELSFSEDDDAIDLFAFRLSQIGEAAGKLSDEFQERNAHIPWRAVTGMRHLIVHEYRRVVPLRLWETANNHMAPLLSACQSELQRLEGKP